MSTYLGVIPILLARHRVLCGLFNSFELKIGFSESALFSSQDEMNKTGSTEKLTRQFAQIKSPKRLVLETILYFFKYYLCAFETKSVAYVDWLWVTFKYLRLINKSGIYIQNENFKLPLRALRLTNTTASGIYILKWRLENDWTFQELPLNT